METNESRPGLASRAASTTSSDTGKYNRPADLQRRRESAVRLPGDDPDPVHPGRRYHRPTTGLRADGYRDGYASALRWLLGQHSEHIDELLRAKLSAIVARSVSA